MSTKVTHAQLNHPNPCTKKNNNNSAALQPQKPHGFTITGSVSEAGLQHKRFLQTAFLFISLGKVKKFRLSPVLRKLLD